MNSHSCALFLTVPAHHGDDAHDRRARQRVLETEIRSEPIARGLGRPPRCVPSTNTTAAEMRNLNEWQKSEKVTWQLALKQKNVKYQRRMLLHYGDGGTEYGYATRSRGCRPCALSPRSCLFHRKRLSRLFRAFVTTASLLQISTAKHGTREQTAGGWLLSVCWFLTYREVSYTLIIAIWSNFACYKRPNKLYYLLVRIIIAVLCINVCTILVSPTSSH